MRISFKTELKPNNKQITRFRQHCGVARHAYNFGNAVILDALKLRETDKSCNVRIAESEAASSAVSACGTDKPLKSHLEAVTKQEIDSNPQIVQLSLF